MPRFRHILFDLDGTLVDSTADIVAAANAARASLGLAPLPHETVRGFIGDGVDTLLAQCVPAEHLHPAIEAYRAHYAAHMLDTTRAYPGVEALLEDLSRAGLALAVVTNKPRRYTVPMLDALGLARFFGAVVGGDGPSGRKPAPGPFLEALAALGGGRGTALVVGDGRNDVNGARAAGIPVCGALYGIGSPEEMRALAPDFLIQSIEELPRILRD